MTSNETSPPDRVESDAEAEVIFTYDEDGTETRAIIADVTCDDAWIAVPESDALCLDVWR